MTSESAMSQKFKALGDPTRLRIFNFLKERCCAVALGEEGDVHPVDGPTVGEVCCHVTGLDRINSTISFHLKELRLAGLISVEKRGKFMICDVNQEAVLRLATYFRNDSDPVKETCSNERTKADRP